LQEFQNGSQRVAPFEVFIGPYIFSPLSVAIPSILRLSAMIYLLVIGTSLWVLFDANSIGVKKGQIKGMGDMGPAGWFIVCLLLWIVGFPLYLAKRGEFKRVNGKT
jgi:hypothetical protein